MKKKHAREHSEFYLFNFWRVCPVVVLLKIDQIDGNRIPWNSILINKLKEILIVFSNWNVKYFKPLCTWRIFDYAKL